MKAIDLIRQGWCQHRAVDGRSDGTIRYCSIGAIFTAYGDTPAGCIATKKFCNTIGIQSKDIANWNDVPERTHQEVIDAFEKAGI